jgi:hypothetical protein
MSTSDVSWSITFEINRALSLSSASVYHHDEQGCRQVIRMVTGPFDTPDDILTTVLELIEHAEWSGQQLQLPVSPE